MKRGAVVECCESAIDVHLCLQVSVDTEHRESLQRQAAADDGVLYATGVWR